MDTQTVSTSQLMTDGADAERFACSFGRAIELLRDSIDAVGLLDPPIVRERAGRFQVVCGWRRVCAAVGLRLRQIPAHVVAGERATDESCMLMAVHDNAARGFNIIEAARVLGKFADLGYSDERLAAGIAPLLGLAQSIELVRRRRSILRLGESAWHTILADERRGPQALLLADLDDEDAARMFELLFVQVRVSAQEAKEMIGHLKDVAMKRGTRIVDLLEQADVADIVDSTAMNPTQKGQRLRALVHAWRFPTLSTHERQFEKAVRGCGFPDGVRVRHSPFFETDKVTISVESRTPDDLRRKADEIRAALRRTEADGLFVAGRRDGSSQ